MKRNKTYSAKEGQIERKWHLADADGKILGRFAAKIALVIRGKMKTSFTRHMDTGDFVVVINSDKIKVTGDKLKKKMYFRHSGYPGGDRLTSLETQMAKDSKKVIEHAVRGMLPTGRLGDRLIRKLKVYKDANYEQTAQNPQPLDI